MLMQRQKWYDADTPEVSVIILNFNKSNLTKECLQAIWKNTFGYRYEIVIVDNGSAPDDLQTLVEAGSHFRLIKLPENRYFSQGCNIGARHSRGRYLVFLNNDAFVMNDWLVPLISVLDNRSDAGAAGPRLINPDGRLQEAGAFINETGQPLQIGKIKPYHPHEEFEVRIVDYCSAACLAIPQKVFAEVGGFDMIYSPAYFEDVDICLKIAATNRLVYYCPESTVVHVQNVTSAAVWIPAEIAQLFERNRKTFLSRWSRWLRARAENCDIPFPTVKPQSAPICTEDVTHIDRLTNSRSVRRRSPDVN